MPLLGRFPHLLSRAAKSLRTIHSAPAARQMFSRLRPIGIPKHEAGLEQSSGHNPAALQDQLRLGAQEDSAEIQHPFRGGQTQVNPASSAQSGHEVTVRQRIRRTNVDASREVWSPDQEVDGIYEVEFVNPRNKLLPGAG